ncbi:MAG TPA: T9SS type A sorting domain-containing protein [Ignavibacteria bacterium]|nr:T9SS type A sorting domain-containing protein [Ignavibacteria bacterium]
MDNSVTKISFELPYDAKVKLVVYDLLGREIKSIFNNQLTRGKYTFEFDGSNFSSGIYFYKLTARDFTAVKRMVLLK